MTNRFEGSIGAAVLHFANGSNVRIIQNNNVVNIQNAVEQDAGWWQLTVAERTGNPFRIELHEIERTIIDVQ